MYKLCIKLFVSIVLCNSAYGIHVEVINAPELRGYNNEIAKDTKNMPKQVLDQILSFLYPIYPMHVRLKQGPESHDIQFSAEVIEYISRIQEVVESRIEITDLSIIDKIMDQLAAQKILPHKFLTGRGMRYDGSVSRNRRKADENSLRLTYYAVPFAPGSIDIGSLFEFIEYSIFVHSKGLTIECITDSFYPKPHAYEINFYESVLYGDYLITQLVLDRPNSCEDLAWYEGFKVSNHLSNHLTWIKTRSQHENYTLLEIRGWKMDSIEIPTNFQPEDEDKPLWPIMLRVIKAIKFGLKNNSSRADIERTLNQIPHPALIISRPESICSLTYLPITDFGDSRLFWWQ